MPKKSKAPSRKPASKAPWEKAPPRGTGKSKLTSAQKSEAKSAAKRAGRPYPNLVDNMRAAVGSGRTKAKGAGKTAAKRKSRS